MYQLAMGTRIRRSPYFEATQAEGVTAFSTYNRMYMPTSYGDPEAEYWRLIEGVSMWDVAVERQIELSGPDAGVLAQALIPRKMDRCKVGQGRYVPICDHDGVLINDPIALKLAEDRYWLSIADSDLVLWARAIAAERRLDVQVFEAQIAPLAVQGPKAEDVIASLFGDWARDIKLFWFQETEVEGIHLYLARSGWSKQGGFELYLSDPTQGVHLWNLVKEAGAPFGIGPGAPNQSERVESGLLSYGADTDSRSTPFEVRMSRFVDLDAPDDAVGIGALRDIASRGAARHQLGVLLPEGPMLPRYDSWFTLTRDMEVVGKITSAAWSPRLKRNIGMALVSTDCAPGDTAQALLTEGPVDVQFVELPFL
ncbi:MAG: glycine cleavage T C-terminal barrel domain-containing protein [Pseudomonadota bacterium]